MKWSLSERIELRDIIAQLDNFHGLRSSSPPKNTLQLRYSDAEELKNDLASSSGGALLVRHLLRVLGLMSAAFSDFGSNTNYFKPMCCSTIAPA